MRLIIKHPEWYPANGKSPVNTLTLRSAGGASDGISDAHDCGGRQGDVTEGDATGGGAMGGSDRGATGGGDDDAFVCDDGDVDEDTVW